MTRHVGTIYKPPDTSTVDFNVHVNDLFRTISQERKKCIIMADFNIDLLTTDTNHQTADFIHNMFTHMFCPTISKPTRITNYSSTLIDNIITNIHEYPIKSGILYNDISDHFPVFNIYKLDWQNTKKYKSIFKRNTNLKNMTKLNTELKNANWARVYNELNPNTSYEIFIKILNSHIDECLPWKKLKVKTETNEWLTKGILTSCKEKNHLYKIYKCNPTIESEQTYKIYKNKLTHIIRLSKKLYFRNKFDIFKNDCRKTWSTINEVLKSKNKKTNINDKFMTSDGNCCTDKNKIVNQFNKYFTSIGTNLNAKLPQTAQDPTHLINNNSANFFSAPTCPAEIINIVNSAKSKKACGYDNIDPYVVQQVIPQIATQLAHIFNRSFTTGIVPNKLKIAKVIPIYKNENPELFANYRPISILPSISKILERLMYNRLYNFLAEHNIISKKQYGFREKYSTYMAIIDLVDKISNNIDIKKHSIGIFLDLSKAFDTIDHQILLRKLQRYGVRGIACDWFKSYLENRVQYVSYNTKDSDYMKIMCGVPQGSILGPLLFIFYINDIVKVSTVLNPVLFADDTSLFHAHTDFDILIEEINEELQKITTWFHTNKLSLNIKKSNFIIFLPKGKKCNIENVKININGNEIKRVNFY